MKIPLNIFVKESRILLNNFTNQTILVVGASGYISSKLIVDLSQYECTIIRASRNTAKLKSIDNIANIQDYEIDYKNEGFKKILQADAKRFDIGLIILSYELFGFTEAMEELLDLRIPIFKVGFNSISETKETFVLLNDTKSYEQISPLIFDISSQLKTKTKVFDLDPIGDDDKTEILDHFENLSKIFNQRLVIVSKEKNPIRKMKMQKNILQIMPLKKAMFSKRYFFEFFYTNSDLLSFDINTFNQLLIPIVED